MSTNGFIVFLRNKNQVIGFDQSKMPKSIFDVSKDLGYTIRVTGGFEYTHEIECNVKDFQGLLDLCKEMEEENIRRFYLNLDYNPDWIRSN